MENTLNTRRNDISGEVREIGQLLINSGHFNPQYFIDDFDVAGIPGPFKVESIVAASRSVHAELVGIGEFLRDILTKLSHLESRIEDPAHFQMTADILGRILIAGQDFKNQMELIPVYGDLLSAYIHMLHRSAAPGRESAIIRMILLNIARRKAIEMDQSDLARSFDQIREHITIAIMSKRYAAYVLAVRGFEVLFRSELEFRTYGTSPEAVALQITNILLKNGIRLSEVKDVVCGGGDLGTLPDGIYVLTENLRDESWKRLHNSSLNRGALIAWELRNLLKHQGDKNRINASLCSPLSFSTLESHDLVSLFREGSREISQSLKGYVKVTPLKSMAALLSEIEKIHPEKLNLLVMTLDELFASAVRKTGPRIVRELAAQEANRALIHFDFGKILDHLRQENFVIPPNFRLASREMGTGVKEICELLMIVESGKISPNLAKNLIYVVDSYAGRVAGILETASTGEISERPNFIAITSMMAFDKYFRQLFSKIRNRIDNPFTPLMCLDSMEHEYLIANHLFEIYVNRSKGDKRLHYTLETRSMKQALQVLGASGTGQEIFSFSTLLDEVSAVLTDGTLAPANLVLVGADNEDALVAVSNARDYGLLDRVALIGDPNEIATAIERTKASISPGIDPKVEVIPINPLATDFESKKQSTSEVFKSFLEDHPDFIIMKGSLDTAGLLREALSIYKSDESGDGGKPIKKMASHTALFVLPDGRFFALSDAAVNPGFRNAEKLLKAIENQLDVVRKVVDPTRTLKVAIITAVEKETSAIPTTLLAAEAESGGEYLKERYGPVVIEGPLSFDLATVPEVAEEKHYEGRIMGDANCLVATEINTANVLYKMLSKTMGSLGLLIDNGSIITAGPGSVPIVLTSRGDTAQTKFNSILLALAYSSAAQDQRRPASSRYGRLQVVSAEAS